MRRKQIVPHLEVGKLYSLADFRSEWALHFRGAPKQYNLPTEALVCQPQMMLPDQARAYYTGYFACAGRVLTYDQAQQLPDFPTPAFYKQHEWLWLVEVYSDWGDDGHIN